MKYKRIKFAIVENESQMFIGTIHYHSDDEGKLEISYGLAKAYWNRGYATEAVRLMIGYLYETIGSDIEFVAGCTAENRASKNVLQKVGFRYTGASSTTECFWHEDIKCRCNG